MNAYRPGGLAGRCMKAMITGGLIRGNAAPGADAPLNRLKEFITQTLGITDIALSVTIGTSGAYRKHTARIMTGDGTPVAYAKLADLDLAKKKIVAEAKNLTTLGSISEILGQVPKLLHFGEIDGCAIIITSAGPDEPGPAVLSSQHEQFLHSIYLALGTTKQFLQSAFWMDVTERINWLWDKVPAAWGHRLAAARNFIETNFHNSEIPLSFVHRDFAPWNTRALREKLFVFDWEDAVPEAPPVIDIIHFNAIQSALAGRRLSTDLREIGRMYSNIVGLPAPSDVDIEKFLIVYWLDLGSYYLKAYLEAPWSGDAGVLDCIAREFDHHFKANRVGQS
jgi:hypothetical protein